MISDLKFALRSLAKTPGTSLAFIFVLALGVGANTAVFSVVEAVLLRPLPYERPRELFMVHSGASAQFGLFTLAEFSAYRERTRAFAGFAATGTFNTNLVDGDEAQLVLGLRVTPDLFDLLGVKPLRGRLLSAQDEDPAAPKVVVISRDLWRTRFGGRDDIIGHAVRVSGEWRTIVGVIPEGFVVPFNGSNHEVVVPLQPEADPARHNHGGINSLGVIGRLGPGVEPSQALADLATVLQSLQREHPAHYAHYERNRLVPLAEQISGDVRPVLATLWGLVGSLLLLAGTNLAGLLLVRGIGRRREIALRAALGSSRGQLLRLLLLECLLLTFAGAIAGGILARLGLQQLLALLPPGVPRAAGIDFNGTALAFTVGMAFVAGILPGLWPLWSFSRADLRSTLQSATRGSTSSGAVNRTRRWLVTVQIALAVALLACSGLFLRSFLAVGSERPGAEPQRTLTARISQPEIGYPDREALWRFEREFRTRLAAIPGVESVGAVSLLPLAPGLATARFRVAGAEERAGVELPSANYRLVTPGYFEAFGLRLLDGRTIVETDEMDRPLVAVIGATMAQKHFPHRNPIGQVLEVEDAPVGRRKFEIVGVVEDVKQSRLDEEQSSDVYIPYRQMEMPAVPWMRLRTYWVLRSTQPAAALEAAFRRELKALDASIPVASVLTLEQVAERSLAVRRFTLVIVGLLTVTAVLLTIAGIYSVMAYGVAQRTREIGVRMALGASVAAILRQVLGEGVGLLLRGAMLGVAATVALSPAIAAQLYRTSPYDPITLAAAVTVLVGVGLLACWIPARRATRVSPLVAISAE